MSSCWCFLFHHTLMHRLAGWLAGFLRIPCFRVRSREVHENNYITPHWPRAGDVRPRGRIFEDFNCNFPIESRPWRGNEIRDSRCVRIGSSSWTSVLRSRVSHGNNGKLESWDFFLFSGILSTFYLSPCFAGENNE